MLKTFSFVNLCVCVSSLKLLLLRSYVSTDFDVHRNWMAITYNLPISQWYYDETSEWTLDYPPLFAAFEFLLALVAQLLGLSDSLILTKDSIRTESIVIFQKCSVIVSDFVYYYAIHRLAHSVEALVGDSILLGGKKKSIKGQDDKSLPAPSGQTLFDALYRPDLTSSIALLLLFQPGLILVDHIHFQYNGFLSGILILSIANIIDRNYLSGSFWFAILLNLKHIYLYCAPAYGMYLLTCYCMTKSDGSHRVTSFITRVLQLGLVVVSVFAITFAPFASFESIEQIVTRLFPFKRGLTHAYWAPNIWSLYNAADKVLATVFKDSLYVKFDMDAISRTKPISSTSGLVQEYDHQYLPSIQPITAFALVGSFTQPLMIKFLFYCGHNSKPKLFMKAVTLTCFSSFMFGWHVHEKAIISVILPLIPISFIDQNLRGVFLRVTLAGTYSLFPLLFQPAEYLTKLTLLVAYYCYARSLTNQNLIVAQSKPNCSKARILLKIIWGKLYSLLDNTFILAIIFIEAYNTLIHGHFNYDWNPVAVLNKYDFLPLMLTSTVSALGITFSYLELYYDFVFGADEAPAVA